MKDMTENEHAALEAASAAAGKFLEEAGESDLSRLSQWGWMEFLKTIIITFSDELRRLESATSERK